MDKWVLEWKKLYCLYSYAENIINSKTCMPDSCLPKQLSSCCTPRQHGLGVLPQQQKVVSSNPTWTRLNSVVSDLKRRY